MSKIKTAAVGLCMVGFVGFGAVFLTSIGRTERAQVTAGARSPASESVQVLPGTVLLRARLQSINRRF